MKKYKQIGFNKYSDYLKSSHWRKRREAYYGIFGKFCKKCLRTKGIQIHHLSYERLGNENDDDLISLCSDCHRQYHRIYKMDLSVESVKEFINIVRTQAEIDKSISQAKKEKAENKKLKPKKKKELSYDGKGKFKTLTSKSIRRINHEAQTEADKASFSFLSLRGLGKKQN